MSKASDFAPSGWQIEKEIKGDVNADGLSDSVLIIQEANAAEGKQRGRGMVVLTAQKDKTWKNAAVADRLLQCVECGEMMGEIDITIQKRRRYRHSVPGPEWIGLKQ